MSKDKIRRRVFLAAPLGAATLNYRGNLMIGDADQSRGISNLATLDETRRVSVDGYINAVAWNSNGSRLAVLSNFGGAVTIWRAINWNIVNNFNRNGGAYSQNSFAFLPDGTLLTAAPIGVSRDPRYTTFAESSLVQWDAATGQPLRYVPDLGYPPRDLPYRIGPVDTFVVSNDGAIVAGINGSSVFLFSIPGWSISRRIVIPPTPKHPDYPASVAISPDARQLAIGTGFGHVHLYNMEDTAPAHSFTAFPGDALHYCEAINFSSDGQLLVTGRGGTSVGEVDDGWTRLWRISDFA